jgi:hypothetical protein
MTALPTKLLSTKLLSTKLEIKSWDEEPFRELPEGHKLSRASTTLAVTEPEIEAEGVLTTLLHYQADQTSTFVALLYVEGRLGDRTGGFALHGTGTYDGTHARIGFTVVPGSGTGELAGVEGTGESVSSHGDYPYLPLTLDYRLG